jgi:alpha/beta superfamily hydrolase
VIAPHTSSVAAAVRIDRQARIREEVEFLGPDRQRLFSCVHRPLTGRPKAGLVICSPLYAEFPHNYRKEVVLARALAANGIAVQRFHYRGTGNSDGAAENVTFDSIASDAIAATNHLEERASVDRVAFLGTRLAAMIAAATAARSDNAPLILWEPALDAQTYFREVARNRLIRDLKDGVAAPDRSRDLLADIDAAGSGDVLGYSIHRGVYRSFLGRKLDREMGDALRRVLLVQLSQQREVRPEYQAFGQAQAARGVDVQMHAIWSNESWWFVGDPSLSARVTRPIVDTTSRWLRATFEERGR